MCKVCHEKTPQYFSTCVGVCSRLFNLCQALINVSFCSEEIIIVSQNILIAIALFIDSFVWSGSDSRKRSLPQPKRAII